MPQKLSSLADGSKIELLTFKGARVVWRKIGTDLPGMPTGSCTFVADKILAVLPFDAQEPNNSDGNRKSYGNNDYTVSNIRQWLNSKEKAGGWYKAQHSADQAPDKSHVASGYNPYDTWDGFLSESEDQEINALMSTTRYIGGYSSNGKSCEDKVFLLTSTEVGLENLSGDGTKIAYFSDNNRRITTPTPQCVENSNWPNNPSSSTANWYWWLATSNSGSSHNVRLVDHNGNLINNYAFTGYYGVRPACNLPSSLLISESTNPDGSYDIAFNEPPTAPQNIKVPETIRSTVQFTVSWDKSTDPDGNLKGYKLQRNIDKTAWVDAYTGSALEYKDTIEFGKQNVQYRVLAYDTDNAESAYTTSELRTVINNRPPKISGSDTDLGSFTTNIPKLEYTVTDEDQDTVTVTEYVDGVLRQTYQAELGTTKTLTFTADQWRETLNGEHTLSVTATDPNGGRAERTATFKKNVATIEFQGKTPLEADEMPTKAIINVQGAIPLGATLHVWACNNGNDAEPTWEDVTSAVQRGDKIFFSNSKKTADKWGVNFKVKVERGAVQGDIFISAIGGNFG